MDRRTALGPAALALLLAACGGCFSAQKCPPAQSLPKGLPQRLSDTGLFRNVRTGELAAGVRPYAPRFELWTDGAAKRRWIWVPDGARIDTSDMDDWQFPVGTKLWKEFVRNGVRVETRLLQKTGPEPGDWSAVAYVWTDDGSDAVAAPQGVENARGTPHDVPTAVECFACHGGRKSRVLGFSALQLAWEPKEEALTLDRLVAEGRLTHPPRSAIRIPGTPLEQEALGVLHANCGHCHNPRRPPGGSACFDPSETSLQLWLPAEGLRRPEDAPVHRTAIPHFVRPGDPDDSWLVERFSSRGSVLGYRAQMPPLGTEEVDVRGLRLLRQWIESL